MICFLIAYEVDNTIEEVYHMFGLEFSDRKKHHLFPKYDFEKALKPNEIESISPLVWQEHCIECAMPACYQTCAHYKPRSDGRCKLFKYGIERFYNKNAILNQNIVIDMNEWAKLETFWFTSGFQYKEAERINNKIVALGKMAQILKLGSLRRFCYYIKEYYIRRIGDKNRLIPHLFIFELINENKPFVLILENRANKSIVYRTSLKVENGFNRFIIPTKELHYLEGYRNYLLIYPEGNEPQLINIVSLEIVSIKPEYYEKYFPLSEKKVKCVVWDLDNTIWDGILAEEGVDGIRIKPNMIAIIKNLDEKGILNSISSKNYENKAIEALKHFGILDYFVCPMINWKAKSQNIKTIAKTLDIGLDTFVFVDDSSFERNEVRENCPNVRVCDIDLIEDYIRKDFFDVPVTEESRRRRESYKEIAIRNKAAEEYTDDFDKFLEQCQMVVSIAEPNQSEVMRCYELLQRTNQLNISGERLSIEQVNRILSSKDYDCYRIKVKDKYGSYGLVGFAVFDISDNTVVSLRHFVFSCRAARKKIEQSFFEYMIEKYKQKGFHVLEIICKITEKNALMREVLEESCLFVKTDEVSEGYKLIHQIGSKFTPIKLVKILEE